jgi:glutamyl-Q tRNA(Asp) synthetase
LHLGHAYSALFAHRAAGPGRFLLRIEDIDRTRARPQFVEAIYEDLAWLGLAWEQPVRVQSEHFEDYSVALDRLSSAELLYPCFCTRADVRAAVHAPHGPDGPVYPGTCRALSPSERNERLARGDAYALRLDTDEAVRRTGPLAWTDEAAGERSLRAKAFGDVVLARKEMPASYHLCVVVDDALQGVELVTRGSDLFEATHVHRLLQALLDLPVPCYHHHRLIVDEGGRRLAKRDDARSVRALRESGLSPDEVRALVQD